MLEKVSWTPTRGAGPLLVVDPDGWHKRQRGLSDPTPDKPLLAPAPSYPLPVLAQQFQGRIVRIGTLTVLAPLNRAIVNVKPGKPNHLMADTGQHHAEILLFASLTPAQWQMLGSPQGLGRNNLTREQQPLFDSYLPAQITLDTETIADNGSSRRSGEHAVISNVRPQARLRLSREALISLWSASSPKRTVTYRQTPDSLLPDGTTIVRASLRPTAQTGFARNRDSAFGVSLRAEVPNRLKPSDLNLDSPVLRSATVTLDGAATVGDLVARIGKATGLELYADTRIERLPLWVRDSAEKPLPVRTSDALTALCYGVTGTFRKVGPAYVLTDDIQGMGSREAILRDWATAARNDWAIQEQKLREQVAAQNTLALLDGWSENSPTVDDALLRQLEAGWRKGEQNGVEVTTASLSPALKEMVNRAVQRTESSPNPTSGDKVVVDIQYRVSLIFPGVGTVATDVTMHPTSLLNTDQPTHFRFRVAADSPPVEPLSQRILLITPPDDIQTMARIVKIAKQHNITQIWARVRELNDAGAENSPLRAAIAAGKAAGIPVVAVAPLLRVLSPPKDASALDRNIAGESLSELQARRAAAGLPSANKAVPVSDDERNLVQEKGDYLRMAMTPEVTERLRQIVQIGETPGLSGLAVEDTVTPGYYNAQYIHGANFGFTLANRLAFLRKYHVDPIDLAENQQFRAGDLDLNLPFFRQMDTYQYGAGPGDIEVTFLPRNEWKEFRAAVADDFLTEAYAQIKKTLPRLPLFTGSFVTWDSPVAPLKPTNPETGETNKASSFYFTIRFQQDTAGKTFTADPEDWQAILQMPRSAPGRRCDGIIMDARDLNADDLAPLLDSLTLPPLVPEKTADQP